MGKSLIIPGADFSANKIQEKMWLTNKELDIPYSMAFNSEGYGCYYYEEALKGKTISKIRVLTSKEGIITLKSIDSLPTVNDTVHFLETRLISVPLTEEFVELQLSTPLYIPSNGGIMVYAPGILKYYQDYNDLESIIHYVFASPNSESSNVNLDYASVGGYAIIHSIGFFGG